MLITNEGIVKAPQGVYHFLNLIMKDFIILVSTLIMVGTYKSYVAMMMAIMRTRRRLPP